MLYIRDATILTPTTQIDNAALLTVDARIAAVGQVDEIVCPDDAQIIDASGLFLVPGFIDLQINGAFGSDFTADPQTIWQAATQLPRYGITAFLPTIITSPPETIAMAQSILAHGSVSGFAGATPLGLHVEGPFLNPNKKGAHNPAHLRLPDLGEVADWSPENTILLVTLAPELCGASNLITSLRNRGIVLGAGHSTATYAEAVAAFDAGVRYGTHLFNAMPSLHHRDPGLAGALLTDSRTTVGLIADGIHIHPAMIKLAWHALGSSRLTLVSDAMAALGMPFGEYVLADLSVVIDASGAHLADGTLAGSILSLDAALRNFVAYSESSLQDALPTVTSTPAAVLGILDKRGRISPGLVADLVLLTPALNVVMTIVRGEVIYTRGS